MADSMQTAATIVSLIAGFFVITTHSRDLSRGLTIGLQNWGIPIPTNVDTPAVVTKKDQSDIVIDENKIGEFDQNTNIYGSDYEKYHAYNTSYSGSYTDAPVVIESCAETDTSIDVANCLIAQKRARDKKCSDGWSLKSADYYKFHYGNELKDSEEKIWWGKNEL